MVDCKNGPRSSNSLWSNSESESANYSVQWPVENADLHSVAPRSQAAEAARPTGFPNNGRAESAFFEAVLACRHNGLFFSFGSGNFLQLNDLIRGNDTIDIQQNLDLGLRFADAENIVRVDILAE